MANNNNDNSIYIQHSETISSGKMCHFCMNGIASKLDTARTVANLISVSRGCQVVFADM